MADLALELDLSVLKSIDESLKKFDQDLNTGVQKLAGQAHLRILEQAQQRLHTRREQYVENLKKPVEVAPGVYMITLDAKAVWIEEGLPPHSMVDDLLRQADPNSKPAKTAKDGSRYRIIPFKQNKGPASQGESERLLTQTIKAELKKLRIPWGTVERDGAGKPLSGRLHTAVLKENRTFETNPLRPPGTAGKPGWGKGGEGQVMQGPAGKSGHGIPLLRGVAIYQTPLWKKDDKGQDVPDLNKAGLQKARRDIMTFRIVSTKHRGVKWEYPGIEGAHFFDDAFEWAKREWEQKMLPEILQRHRLQGN